MQNGAVSENATVFQRRLRFMINREYNKNVCYALCKANEHGNNILIYCCFLHD